MPEFFDQFEKKVFDPFAKECQRVFEFLYPAVNFDKNGLTEAPLVSNFFASIKGPDNPLKESVWWDEFPLPDDARYSVNGKKNTNHLDALLYDPTTKSVLMIEAKNGQAKLGNVVEIVQDIIRMANVANHPAVISRHFWDDPKKHVGSARLVPEKLDGLYGMSLFWFWDNSGSDIATIRKYISTKVARYMRFKSQRKYACIEAQKDDLCIRKSNLYIEEIDIRYPDTEYHCYVCCYLWKHAGCGNHVMGNEAVLDEPEPGLNAFLSILDELKEGGQLENIKATDREKSLSPLYIYLWPKAFQDVMPNNNSYKSNKRQVWIDLSGGCNPIALVVIDEGRQVIGTPNGWRIQKRNHDPYALGNASGAIYPLGSDSDLLSEEGLETIKNNLVEALGNLGQISFS